MFNNSPHDPSLTDEQRRELREMEYRMTIDDPALVQSLRTGRAEPKRIDPVQAAIVAVIATPIIALITFLAGPGAGTAATAVALVAVVIRLLTTKRSGTAGPSAYR